MDSKITIFDTTLRDGARQVGVSFLKEDKMIMFFEIES